MGLSAAEITWVFKVLKNIDTLSSYSREDLEGLIGRLGRKTYAQGEHIISQGDSGQFFFLIYRGQVVITAEYGKKEIRISSLAESDYFGEMSLLTGKPCVATVKAVVETEVFMLNPDDFRFILMHNPRLLESMSFVITERRKDLFYELGLELGDHEDDLLSKMKAYFGVK